MQRLFCRDGKITYGVLDGGGNKHNQASFVSLTYGFFMLRFLKRASIARIKKAPANCRGLIVFVGMARFELATSWSQTRRDNRATLHPERWLSVYYF